MPGIPVPEFELPESAANLAKSLQDGIYVIVGLAVLVFQRAQVQRLELQKQVEALLADLREPAGDAASGTAGNLASSRQVRSTSTGLQLGSSYSQRSRASTDRSGRHVANSRNRPTGSKPHSRIRRGI